MEDIRRGSGGLSDTKQQNPMTLQVFRIYRLNYQTPQTSG